MKTISKDRPVFTIVCIWSALLLINLLAASCAGEKRDPEVAFIRAGIAVRAEGVVEIRLEKQGGPTVNYRPGEAADNVSVYGNGLTIFEQDWRPGDRYTVFIKTEDGKIKLDARAPLKPSPVEIAEIELESVRPFGGTMGSAPDTVVRFSPNGRYLAIGSFKGFLRVYDVKEGRMVFEKLIAEGMVKRLAWSKNNGPSALFVGEQSPDGFITSFNAKTWEVNWRFRLADDLETSTAGSSDDRFAVYNFPGAYEINSLPDGDLLAIGAHGWYKGENYVYKCRAYRIDGATGNVKWTWPEHGALPYGVSWFGASANGSVMALLTSTWQPPKANDARYKNGTLYALNGKNGRPVWEYTIPPFKPFYDKATAWQGVAADPAGAHVFLGLNDGRVMLFDSSLNRPGQAKAIQTTKPLWIDKPGAPIKLGDIPVSAYSGFCAMDEKTAYVVFPGTTIPPGAGGRKPRHPIDHPKSHCLMAYGLDGSIKWQWRAGASPQGLALSDNGDILVMGMAEDSGSQNVDFFGVSVFDTRRPGGGFKKHLFTYPTEGPVFFNLDATRDGSMIALTELPLSHDDGRTVYGKYRVHVVR